MRINLRNEIEEMNEDLYSIYNIHKYRIYIDFFRIVELENQYKDMTAYLYDLRANTDFDRHILGVQGKQIGEYRKKDLNE